MSNIILYTIATLSIIGLLAAVILYLTARKFEVHEDPRVQEIEEALPGVNCGACGYPGCHNFAQAFIKAENLSKFYCPVGGNTCMSRIAAILGKDISAKDPMIAVVRCNGTLQNRKHTNVYDGAKTCAIAHNLYIGDTGCAYGCFGLGDCVVVCPFDAIHINPKTGLPVVSEEKCTACGKCVLACPRSIIELRKKGPKGRRVYVCCVNKDKGGLARQVCSVSCIGCGRCVKECPFDAITLENNLAYIDFNKCKLCRKCVSVCPTHAIWEVNFPLKKETPKDNVKTAKIVDISFSDMPNKKDT